MHDPAVGALEIAPNVRLKARKAIKAELRRIKIRLYLRLADLYVRKLLLSVRYAVLYFFSDLRRRVSYPFLRGHVGPSNG